jgi:replication factor C small subunit
MSGPDVVKQISKEIWNIEIPDEQKLKTLVACGEAEFRIVEGSDEFIQLEALLAVLASKH